MTRLTMLVAASALASFAMVATSADAGPKKPKKPAVVKPAAEEQTGEKKKPTTTAAAAETPAVVAMASSDFDRQAAATSIAEISLQRCKATNAPRGEGHVQITFTPGGPAATAVIDKGPWVGTPVAKCMQKEFKKAKVPPFKGEPITVGKSFKFE